MKKRSYFSSFFNTTSDTEKLTDVINIEDSHISYLEHLKRSEYGRFEEITNRLRDSCDLELKLPPIVLIGEESSGKSSTCSRIVGYNLFPRDENICTRTPVKYQLTHVVDGDDYISINDNIFTFGSGVVKYINDWMNENVCETTGIGETELLVKVYSKNVPTITFIDLPGIVLFDVNINDSTGISEITTRIVEKYISDEDTLIVAIVPARDIKNRLRSSVALNLVDKYNARDRTFCAITKVDTTEDMNFKKKGKDTPYHEIIEKLTLSIKSCPPYIGLINTDTTHINEMTIRDANKNEQIIQKRYFSNLRENFGIEALMLKLIAFALNIIRNRWVPKTLKRLHTLIQNKKQDVKALGVDPKDIQTAEILSCCAKNINRTILHWSSVYMSTESVNSTISELFSKVSQFKIEETGIECVQHIMDKHLKIQKYLAMPKDIFNTLCDRLFECIEKFFLSDNELPIRISRFKCLREHIILLFHHFVELKLQTVFVNELSQSIISFKQIASLSGDKEWNWVNLEICIRNSLIEWLLMPITKWIADTLCPVLLKNYLDDRVGTLEETEQMTRKNF
jgi:predicted GTPase